MSLINKMLQDLDARGTPGGDAFPSHVKPVSGRERRASALRLGGLCAGGVLALGALGWLGWQQLHEAPAAGSAPAAPKLGAHPGAQPGLPARPAPAMTGTITQLPVTRPDEAPVTAVAAPAAPAAPAAAPVPEAPAEPVRAAHPSAFEHDAAPAPRRRAPADEPARVREPAREAEPAAVEPKSVSPMEPDSAEARQARQAAAIELATREARLARVARLSAPAGPARQGVGHKGIGAFEGRQESPAQRAENEYRRALASLQDGHMNEALGSLQLALRIDPGHDAARQTLVGLLVEANRSDDAIRELQAGLAQDPRQPALAMLLARLQIEHGGSGIETLMRSLPYAGNATQEGAEYHAFLAGALQRQGRQREAAEQYQQALRAAPGNGVWWMGLGISLQADKRNAEALDAFQRARASGTLSAELGAFVERRLQQLGR